MLKNYKMGIGYLYLMTITQYGGQAIQRPLKKEIENKLYKFCGTCGMFCLDLYLCQQMLNNRVNFGFLGN